MYRAAKYYDVPLTTLRDRVDNRISIDTLSSGPPPLFNQIQEAKLVEHIKDMAYVGYGYTRSEILNMATDYAVHLGKRASDDKVLSMNWFYGFISRWPELRVIKPSSLSEQRAKCASEESLINYFEELNKIFEKYDLADKPEHIYNIDEKGINTEYRPQNVVAAKGYQPQVVMGNRSKTVTLIGAGNAVGSQVPPFFIFPGQRMMPELMKGQTPGSAGTVTTSGWSNAAVFREYLQDHFIKYVQGRDSSEPVLILYDGHRSHFSLDLIEWARTNNIILFVLPPHCSHILQPMDVGCFGPFQIKYSQECQTFSRCNGRIVSRYDVCALACKAYSAALTPANLRAAFAKTGIFPLKCASEMIRELESKIAPSQLYLPEDMEDASSTAKNTENSENSSKYKQNKQRIDKENHDTSEQTNNFFQMIGGEVCQKIAKRKRRNINDIVGGKAVTENETIEKMMSYINESSQGKKQKKKGRQIEKDNTNLINTSKVKGVKESKTQQKQEERTKSKKNPPTNLTSSPQPGPFHINLISSMSEEDSENESESQIPEEDKCCVCKRFYAQDKESYQVSFTQWACCDECGHWVHLKYCTPIKVVRRETSFKCPCC